LKAENIKTQNLNLSFIVALFPIGEWDIRKAAVSGTMKKLNRYFDKKLDEIEIQIRMEQKLKRNVSQGVLLCDLRDVDAVQHVNFVSKLTLLKLKWSSFIGLVI